MPDHDAPIYLYATTPEGGGLFVASARPGQALVPYTTKCGEPNLSRLAPDIRAACERIIEADAKLALPEEAEDTP